MATREPISLDPNFKEFIRLMNSEGAEYLMLGGFAVNYYGYHRFTGDIDFWIETSVENAHRVHRVLQQFGMADSGLKAERFTVPNKVHMFGRVPIRIDLLTGPSGVEFSACYARRQVAEVDGVEIPIISLADLRMNKSASGRDKDLIDLKHLPES
ncbi:MAG: hypothetical protein JWM57_4414 [Phycisphaerales bacterium]|nr:hypothetical protein [Phycisphaerales bacterium]